MIKLRVEGTELEIRAITVRWARIGLPSDDITKTFKVKSISKFYPNRQKLSVYPFTGKSENGRVYLEIE